MRHFSDYEEYRHVLEESGISGEKSESELVLEDNTIYEIDVTCEKCLRSLWKRDIEGKQRESR